MIIDFHTHTFPDDLAARALAVLTQRAGVPALTDGTNNGLRASMRRAGVDYSVTAPIATRPAQVRAINAWAAEVNACTPDLICLGTLHPALTDWQAEVERLQVDGLPGVKLHHDYQECYVDDPVMLPMYHALADAGLLLLVHAGVDIGLPPPVHCTPDRLARVLDAVPDHRHRRAHGRLLAMGGGGRAPRGPCPLLDTSYSRADLGTERMSAFIRAHGAARVLFATDSPWTEQQAEVAGIRALPLADEEKQAILGGNAERLLQGYFADRRTTINSATGYEWEEWEVWEECGLTLLFRIIDPNEP